ncbi:MAG: PH domain-containing protein [bacterium]
MNKLVKAGSIRFPNADCDSDFIKYTQKQTEKILYILHPSMLRHLGICIFCSITFWAIIPIIVYIFLYCHNKTIKYIIMNERIRIIKGLLIRKIIDLELYRVKDISLVVPFHLKMAGLGSIELITSDPSNPYIVLEAVRNIDQLEEAIRFHVERRRDEKNVQEIDQYRYEKK